jgi:hypothetical protein
MIYNNGIVINPENFRIPSYTISPFSTKKLENLKNIISENISNIIDNNLSKHFGNYEITMSGKEAIFKALSFYKLQENDEVYIVTTSGNLYVSSCVTNEIEKQCKWSRTLGEKTKIIFVIHEFGNIYDNIETLAKLNIPIIEDFAMSMFSEKTTLIEKKYSDFSIYSLPKFFPVQFGGILKYNKSELTKEISLDNSKPFQKDLKKIISYYLERKKNIIARRKKNYNYFVELFKTVHINCRLNLRDYETPSVFMFNSEIIDLDGLKVYLQKNGIECSKFYGENSFFLPVHQELSEFDIEYIFHLIKYFINDNR